MKIHKPITILLFTVSLSFAKADTYTNISFSSTVPSDVSNGTSATKQDLATFAWQEFIALNWPAKVNPNPSPGLSKYYRTQASSDALASTGSGGTLVWHTYPHRVEVFPSSPKSGKGGLPDINSIPSYGYSTPYQKVNITANNSKTDLTLFNNLDEASEISLANMYYKPFTKAAQKMMKKHGTLASHEEMSEVNDAGIKAAIVYEAKANKVIYDYVNSNGFQEFSPRSTAAGQTVKKINNMAYTQGATYELPFGSIEIKASWRRYDSSVDNLNNFIWQKGIYYTGKSPNYIAYNDIMLLVGLHIIHKTPSFPSFTFATFEHVDNEKDGFIYTNTNPQTATANGVTRMLPDPGTIEAKRQYPLPDSASNFDLVTFNSNVQKQLQSQYGSDIFLANYQLIGIQAQVVDNPNSEVPAQEFYLSNFATETNDTLQFFQGSLGGPLSNIPDPDQKQVHVYDSTTQKFVAHSAGGCQGCHGAQGQKGGYDFSVISAKGNFFLPEGVEPYPGGQIIPQNPEGFPLQQTNNNQ
jgi:hypothetical protein